MSRRASRDLKPLSQVAIIDQPIINQIVDEVIPLVNQQGGLTLSQVKADADIADAIYKKHAPGSDDQDLSNYVNTEDQRLSDSRNPLTHAHLASDITGTAVLTNDARLSDARTPTTHGHSQADVTGLVSTLNTKEQADPAIQVHITAPHAPAGAQANADITKAEIEAKLTGEVSSHSHASQTFKCGVATKNINDASTVQNIAHGLGRIPKVVKVLAHCAYVAALSEIVQGCYDGSHHAGLCLCSAEGTTTALIDNIYNSTAAELGFTAATGTNPYTGANRQTGVITCDTTNIIITWTKAGTVASNVVNILWEVS